MHMYMNLYSWILKYCLKNNMSQFSIHIHCTWLYMFVYYYTCTNHSDTVTVVFILGHGKLDLIKAYQILSNYKPQARYVVFSSIFKLNIRSTYVWILKVTLYSLHSRPCKSWKEYLPSEKRWQLNILPQYLANLAQPIRHKENHIFAIFVPVLRFVC